MSAAPLWTADEAAQATGGKATADWSCTGICSDSRKVERGDLFIALKGPNHDAHEFVADAFERGATAALLSSLPVFLFRTPKSPPKSRRVSSPARLAASIAIRSSRLIAH